MATARTEELARLRPKLMAFALQRTRSRDQAEDAVQEALVAALEGLHRYAGGSSLSTWLFGILKHKIVDGLRRGPREEALDMELDDLQHEGPGPEQTCASRNALAAIDRSLDSLPVRSAQAFVLREVLGMETDEVCRTLQVTPTHCWVLVHRARMRLRACPEVGRIVAEAG
ncbi:MAG: sigma-70 family RNA polymerase sigma factor [Betaproteobacteria bacterium]|nr:sigma-70 family RNA polymerase sigma factor [Betaproteobacteria bacterium]MDH4324351.1 sigma-70 family RNA polymerase sigma factor [Betaproteobacteria bacterium]